MLELSSSFGQCATEQTAIENLVVYFEPCKSEFHAMLAVFSFARRMNPAVFLFDERKGGVTGRNTRRSLQIYYSVLMQTAAIAPVRRYFICNCSA